MKNCSISSLRLLAQDLFVAAFCKRGEFEASRPVPPPLHFTLQFVEQPAELRRVPLGAREFDRPIVRAAEVSVEIGSTRRLLGHRTRQEHKNSPTFIRGRNVPWIFSRSGDRSSAHRPFAGQGALPSPTSGCRIRFTESLLMLKATLNNVGVSSIVAAKIPHQIPAPVFKLSA